MSSSTMEKTFVDFSLKVIPVKIGPYKVIHKYTYPSTSQTPHSVAPRTDEIEKALGKLMRNETNMIIRVHGASRTDTGVHARGQVIVFWITSSLDDRTFHRSLSTRLPQDILCRECHTCDNRAFDPRADAITKTYVYHITSSPSVFTRHIEWTVRDVLDHHKMQQVARAVFVHQEIDYSSFASKSRDNVHRENHVCRLEALEIITMDSRVDIRIRGNRFLNRMVRNLVGALVDVGRGKLSERDLRAILEAKSRSALPSPGAPAHGLALERVEY